MKTPTEAGKPNRLIAETSPYLRQHAYNPVDWHPWSEDAFEQARRENKPVLLSIGYSACHWCHVMEHESFENHEIANLMNEHFINIKVDREERPDLDAIYMSAVQMMTGHGGWPMTVFLTPDKVPFYGGTYFPPEDRHGMPGFPRVLLRVSQTYQERREDVTASSAQILEHLAKMNEIREATGSLRPELLDEAFRGLRRGFDHFHGGFGAAPKFPAAMSLMFLLRTHARTGDPQPLEMVELSLKKMARGGIYDQLGGGFHRYSVDEKWLVPHFEKMLYDNALLSRLYLDAFLVTGNRVYRRIVEETLGYVLREMTDPEGGFYSTQDADSEGHEGKFFVWTPEEINAVVGPEEGEVFCRVYDVTEWGNFEGKNILNLPRDLEVVAKLDGVQVEELESRMRACREKLFAAREKRVKPDRDEKILTAWNGLMIRSFAEAGAALGRSDYLDVAGRSAQFIWSNLGQGGRLLRTYKDGRGKLDGYLDDYAYLADGLLALYFATFDPKWFLRARGLVDQMLDRFWDRDRGGFYFTAHDHEPLIVRTKDFYDNATPAGNSVGVHVLLQMSALTGEEKYRAAGGQILHLMSEPMRKLPSAFGHLLCGLDSYLAALKEIAIVGDPAAPDTRSLLSVIRSRYLPNKVIAVGRTVDGEEANAVPLLRDRHPIEGKATVYICHNFMCKRPVTTPEALQEQLLFK